MQAEFVNGLTLSESFYNEAIKPILREHFPNLHHSAALIGNGSEVLGYDNVMSSDHHWGPRAILFLEENQLGELAQKIKRTLADNLPRTFRGYPTNFTEPLRPGEVTQALQFIESGPINHRVEIHSVRSMFQEQVGIDISAPLSAGDWLAVPQQKLLTMVAGKVFHDDLNLEEQRERFAYYPRDIKLYILASLWTRIEQEGHLMGRAGSVGDETGAAIIAARLVRDIIHICFVLSNQYAPYPKWLGTAFSNLPIAHELNPILLQVLSVGTWKERELHLVRAYELLAEEQNKSKLSKSLPSKVKDFYDRPFKVISTGEYSEAICALIEDPQLKLLAQRSLIGSIDVFSDSTDLLCDEERREALKHLYLS